LDSNPTKIHEDDRHTSSLVWRGRRLQHPYSTENISDIRNNNNHQTQTTTPPIGTTIGSGLHEPILHTGIQDMLKAVALKKKLNYDEWLKGLKEKKQWHVEVY
jgi:predicted NAD/FAD-binding protein